MPTDQELFRMFGGMTLEITSPLGEVDLCVGEDVYGKTRVFVATHESLLTHAKKFRGFNITEWWRGFLSLPSYAQDLSAVRRKFADESGRLVASIRSDLWRYGGPVPKGWERCKASYHFGCGCRAKEWVFEGDASELYLQVGTPKAVSYDIPRFEDSVGFFYTGFEPIRVTEIPSGFGCGEPTEAICFLKGDRTPVPEWALSKVSEWKAKEAAERALRRKLFADEQRQKGKRRLQHLVDVLGPA